LAASFIRLDLKNHRLGAPRVLLFEARYLAVMFKRDALRSTLFLRKIRASSLENSISSRVRIASTAHLTVLPQSCAALETIT
jgi:hypothetical protein